MLPKKVIKCTYHIGLPNHQIVMEAFNNCKIKTILLHLPSVHGNEHFIQE